MQRKRDSRYKFPVLLVIFLAGLSIATASASGSAAAKSGKKFRVGVAYSIVHPFFDTCTDGFNEVAAKYGDIELFIDAPKTGDVADQIRILEDFLSKGVDALAICPTEANAVIPIIKQAMDRGIPTLVFGVESPDSQAICYVGTDQKNFSETAADLLAELIGKQGNIVISQGLPTQLDQQQRVDYFVAKVKKDYPGINIVDTQTGKGNAELTLANVENMLQANPNVVGLYGTDAAAGPAVQTAFKTVERYKNIKVVVGDTLPEIIQGVREGSITKTIAQRPKNWAIESLEVLYQIHTGKIKIADVPPIIDTGTFILDKNNVDKYFDANGNQIAELK
jgi:ribose transport system substrate-binding protein